jgi:glutamyl-tRNA synthetase
VLGPDGERLAKRHGDSTAVDLATLAVSLDLADPGEAVTAADLVGRFDPDRVPRSPWVWHAP